MRYPKLKHFELRGADWCVVIYPATLNTFTSGSIGKLDLPEAWGLNDVVGAVIMAKKK